MVLRRTALVSLLLASVFVYSSIAASAGTTVGAVSVTAVDISQYPDVTLGISVIGDNAKPAAALTVDSFEVAQSGRPVSGLSVAEERSGPVALVLALDTSGSMVDYIGGAKAVALELLGQLQPDDQVALTTFDERADPVIKALTADHELVRQSVGGLEAFPDRNTAFYSGLFQAVRLASDSRALGKAVVVLTDGEEFGEVSASLPAEIKALATEHGVQVYTIYIGTEQPSNLFNEIANISGGLRLDSTAGAAETVSGHVDSSLRSVYSLQFVGALPDVESPFDPENIQLSVKTESTTETIFSLCQYSPPPAVWLPQVAPSEKLADRERLQAEVICAGGRTVQAVRYYLDGKVIETVSAPPFSYQLFTERLARGDHSISAEVVFSDGTARSTKETGFVLSGNSFNPAYLLFIFGLAVAVLLGFLALSRRRERRWGQIVSPAQREDGFQLPSFPGPVAGSLAQPQVSNGARLEVVSGPNQGQTYRIDGSMLVGRSPAAGVLLSGSSVSREHARITATGTNYRLQDLGSTNGTKVNGRNISDVILKAGDRIEIAPYELEFEV